MVTKTDHNIARALHWARIHAGEHADTIIEALAAYDPECGARTVSQPAQDDVMSKSRAKRIAALAQAPERRAVTYEDARLVAGHFVGGDQWVNADDVEDMRAALEYLAGVPAAQPAPDAGAVPVVFRHVPLPDTKWKGMFTDTWLPFMPQHRDYHEKRAAEYGWRIEYAYLHPASAASEAADAQLADTQRAIIEAAEARGYARAKTEGEAEARDAATAWLENGMQERKGG